VVSTLEDAWVNQDALEPLIARGLALLGDNRGLAWARLKLLERRYETIPAGPIFATRWEGLDPEAVRIARADGTEADFARTLDWHDSRSLRGLYELIPRIDAWRDPAARLRGLDAVVAFVSLTQRASSAERLCAKLEALAEELGSLPALALASVYRGALLSDRGQFEAAAASTARATALAERFAPAGRVHALAGFIGAVTTIHLAPDWERLAGETLQVATSRDRVPSYGLRHAAAASLGFAKAERDGEARGLLAHIMPALLAADPWDHAQNGAVCMAGAAIWQLQAADLAAELLPCARALIEAGVGDYHMTSNELTVAFLATLLGRTDEALEFFARARATFDERGLRPQRAGVDHFEGVARRLLRQPGATRLLESARAQYAALGMSEWSLRDTRSADLPDGLTRREAEILRLLAAGGTNKEIAAELVVSVHTVERHLLNAYRKASVRNRADATAYVLRVHL
jgi:DNA-binding CsgD family transcriptional regulator